MHVSTRPRNNPEQVMYTSPEPIAISGDTEKVSGTSS